MYMYTHTVAIFTYVYKLYITYSVHGKFQFVLLELLQTGTKDARLFMQIKNTIEFMVQWSGNLIFFKTEDKMIGGDGGVR